ncbi:hypothetical protein GGR51DRAFT_274993 [Nemania sp. FL0031]|nr:hypothetical protein GGR51DRAFT_274993 [Nemania sp. FL0031]
MASNIQITDETRPLLMYALQHWGAHFSRAFTDIVPALISEDNVGDSAGLYDSDSDSSTPSHYSFHGNPSDESNPSSLTRITASDARAQHEALSQYTLARPYPSRFANHERLQLSTLGDWAHYPLIPGTTIPWSPQDGSPGGVRSVYRLDDPGEIDVVYHDPDAETTARGSHRFALARYHPGRHRASR